MSEVQSQSAKPRNPKYLSVVEGFALANDLAKCRLSIVEFARQRGVTTRRVQYWSARARVLAEKNAPKMVQVAEISPTGEMVPTSPPPRLPAAPSPPPGGEITAPSSPPPVIEVQLKNGIRLGIRAGFSPDVLSFLCSFCAQIRFAFSHTAHKLMFRNRTVLKIFSSKLLSSAKK